ncbi:MAG TPA: type 1 glutamine amidotransferase [Lactovum miscens]|uniref:lipid II isoglutaminyl synthase subunit GatD n=1 Tax=Lactovum miscens TaxID=190387 RepID=UPI002ED84FE7
MTYTSIQTLNPEKYTYQIRVAHLYGDLMNTYGDNGNILLLKYIAEKLGAATTFKIVSLGDNFKKNDYDLVFWGGGQDFEQEVIAEDLYRISSELKAYIEAEKPLLSICGGYQMLGEYYINASGKKILGTGVLPHYTKNLGNNRFIGDIETHNEEFNETYYGFENHSGITYLAGEEKPLGLVIYGGGNNPDDHSEGLHYKNTYGTYFHGPILSRNPRLAYRLIKTAILQKYPNAEISEFNSLFKNLESEQIKDYKRKVEKHES